MIFESLISQDGVLGRCRHLTMTVWRSTAGFYHSSISELRSILRSCVLFLPRSGLYAASLACQDLRQVSIPKKSQRRYFDRRKSGFMALPLIHGQAPDLYWNRTADQESVLLSPQKTRRKVSVRARRIHPQPTIDEQSKRIYPYRRKSIVEQREFDPPFQTINAITSKVPAFYEMPSNTFCRNS